MAQVFKRYHEVNLQAVRAAYNRMGYPWFTKGLYNLNLFAIRSNDVEANTFNDLVGVAYVETNEGTNGWRLRRYDATTDPGTYYRLHPMNDLGAAILVPGYYKGMFRIGKHRGQYEALVQATSIQLYRDNNKDNKLDFVNPVLASNSGINLHRATATVGGKSIQVDKWSAGCQVIAANNSFKELMNVAKKAASIWGNSFSYALFTEDQFFGGK